MTKKIGWTACIARREAEKKAYLKIEVGQSSGKLLIIGEPEAIERDKYGTDGEEKTTAYRFRVYMLSTGDIHLFDAGAGVFDGLVAQMQEYERDMSKAVFNIRHPRKPEYAVDYVRDATEEELAGLNAQLQLVESNRASA